MKIAAGCFGCLAFFFFVMIFVTAPLVAQLSTMSPDVAQSVGPMIGYINYANDGCCCLSALLAVVFLAVGMMGGKKDGIQ